MADPVLVPPPNPGWVTVVFCDHETGAVGSVPVRLEDLGTEIRQTIDDGLDVAIRYRAAALLGVDDWAAVSADRAREVLAKH